MIKARIIHAAGATEPESESDRWPCDVGWPRFKSLNSESHYSGVRTRTVWREVAVVLLALRPNPSSRSKTPWHHDGASVSSTSSWWHCGCSVALISKSRGDDYFQLFAIILKLFVLKFQWPYHLIICLYFGSLSCVVIQLLNFSISLKQITSVQAGRPSLWPWPIWS